MLKTKTLCFKNLDLVSFIKSYQVNTMNTESLKVSEFTISMNSIFKFYTTHNHARLEFPEFVSLRNTNRFPERSA